MRNITTLNALHSAEKRIYHFKRCEHYLNVINLFCCSLYIHFMMYVMFFYFLFCAVSMSSPVFTLRQTK